MNALNNAKVGDYLNQHFVSTFQKVGSFRVVGGQKQGGNVASYLCTPNGGILDAIAGPVDASTLLREARWVVENRKTALLESQGNVQRYKEFFRLAHADLLPAQFGLTSLDWRHMPMYQPTEAALDTLLDDSPAARQLNQAQRVHLLLATYPLVKLDQAYKVVYEKIVGEKISTRPVAEGKDALAPESNLSSRLAKAPKGWDPLASAGKPLQLLPTRPPSPPTAEELREQAHAQALAAARTTSSETLISSGAPLNTLLDDLQSLRGKGTTLQTVPLAPATLGHVNVTTQANGPSTSLLRDGGRLRWPIAWRTDSLQFASKALQQSLEAGLPKAIAQAKEGNVDANLLTKLQDDVAQMQKLLDHQVAGLKPDLFIQANRYLQQLKDAVNILGRDDAAKFLDGTFALDPDQIKTVADLAAFMSTKRLKFAPAASGDEAAYLDLHRALVLCDGTGEPKQTPADAGEL